MPLFFILFLLVPIIELYLLIQVGSVIGVLPTVMLAIGTAFAGVWLLRMQGLRTFMRVQETMARGEVPAIEMMEGMMLLVAGVTLITPGFATDAAGFLLLLPPFRRWIVIKFIENSRFVIHPGGGGFHRHHASRDERPQQQGPVTLDGEWKREDD